MFRSRILALIGSFSLIFDATGCAVQGGQPSSLSTIVGDVANSIKTTIGTVENDSYPSFSTDVDPLIADNSGFVAFLDKYQNVDDFSEKDQVDIIFQLGIPQNFRGWITPNGWAKIERFYPSAGNTADNGQEASVVRVAFNTSEEILADTSPGLLADVGVGAPASLLAAQAGAVGEVRMQKALAAILLRNPKFWKFLPLFIAADIVLIIKNDQDADCAQGGCTQTNISIDTQGDQGHSGLAPCVTITGKIAIPKVTYALIRFDQVPPSKPHFPYKGDHYHYTLANQNPSTGQCFWSGSYVFDTPIPGALSEPEDFLAPGGTP